MQAYCAVAGSFNHAPSSWNASPAGALLLQCKRMHGHSLPRHDGHFPCEHTMYLLLAPCLDGSC